MNFYFDDEWFVCLFFSSNGKDLPTLSRLRSYHREETGPRPIAEVKSCKARRVLGWLTAGEYLVL